MSEKTPEQIAKEKYAAKEATKQKQKVWTARSTAKRYINEYATQSDLDELKQLITAREEELR